MSQMSQPQHVQNWAMMSNLHSQISPFCMFPSSIKGSNTHPIAQARSGGHLRIIFLIQKQYTIRYQMPVTSNISQTFSFIFISLPLSWSMWYNFFNSYCCQLLSYLSIHWKKILLRSLTWEKCFIEVKGQTKRVQNSIFTSVVVWSWANYLFFYVSISSAVKWEQLMSYVGRIKWDRACQVLSVRYLSFWHPVTVLYCCFFYTWLCYLFTLKFFAEFSLQFRIMSAFSNLVDNWSFHNLSLKTLSPLLWTCYYIQFFF